MSQPDMRFITAADGARIAARVRDGAGPAFLWLGGFHSDMEGTKALALDAWAADQGRACVRFDYFGHGASDGDFADGTVSRWIADALLVLDTLCEGPVMAVGSSMGGWIALHLLKRRPQRIAGLNLIAPAPDFTEALMWDSFPPEVKAEIETSGRWMRPSAYEAPYPVTRALIEDGRRNLLLHSPIPCPIPVRIVQGRADPDVPWTHALRLLDTLEGDDIRFTLVKAGDHRLSTPGDLALLRGVWGELGGVR